MLPIPISPEFVRHRVLSGGTQRRTLSGVFAQSEDMKILHIALRMEPPTVAFTVARLCSWATTASALCFIKS